MATTAIAILNYNGKEFISKFLPTLLRYSGSTPIYIGDNCSTDGSVELIKSNFPEVLLFELDENNGYSKGYNLLLKEINYDYVALINSDIEVTSNWLNPLIKALNDNNSLAAVQPKIKAYQQKEYFEYAGAAGGYIDAYGYPFCRGRVFDTIEKDNGQYDNNQPISWASGACFLVRKSAFDLVGGFDNDFFAHMEEIDLCLRLAHKKYSIQFVHDSTVYHVGGGTLAYESPFKTYLNFRNGLYMLIKNLPQETFNRKLFVRVILDWFSAFYFLFQGKGKQFIAVFQAHIKVLRNSHSYYAKRDTNGSDNETFKHYSIVWQYFIKGKKKFNNLEK